jgi:hypothetical protein
MSGSPVEVTSCSFSSTASSANEPNRGCSVRGAISSHGRITNSRHVVERDDVDVEGAWPPPLLPHAIMRGLDLVRQRQEFPGTTIGLDKNNTIEVIRLVGSADGSRPIDVRRGDDIGRGIGIEHAHGSAERLGGVPQVGAESEHR